MIISQRYNYIIQDTHTCMYISLVSTQRECSIPKLITFENAYKLKNEENYKEKLTYKTSINCSIRFYIYIYIYILS